MVENIRRQGKLTNYHKKITYTYRVVRLINLTKPSYIQDDVIGKDLMVMVGEREQMIFSTSNVYGKVLMQMGPKIRV